MWLARARTLPKAVWHSTLSLYEWGWELVQEGRPLAGMAEALQAEYTVASAPAMAAVLALVMVSSTRI